MTFIEAWRARPERSALAEDPLAAGWSARVCHRPIIFSRGTIARAIKTRAPHHSLGECAAIPGLLLMAVAATIACFPIRPSLTVFPDFKKVEYKSNDLCEKSP
jgi:hypothetical protein